MKYENIFVGTKEVLTHLISKSDIEKFVELTGDDNKLHVDEAFASKTSFKKPVVHGMLGASFISTLIGTKLPGDGALWFSQTLEFLLPVRIGDLITVSAEVIKKSDRDRIIELNIEISNQNRQIVTRGISKIKVIEEEIPQANEILGFQSRKVALILGATGGIGKATCLQLAKDGFDLVVHYNKNYDKALALKNEILIIGSKVEIIKADISIESQIDELVNFCFRKFKNIDLFVNCASSSIPPIKVTDLLWIDFVHQFEVNIKVNLQIIQKILPNMILRKSGKIITISSIYTDKPNINLSHYITSKTALEGFTKSMALELAPKGIILNMISPSLISTELTSDIPEKIKLMAINQTPIKRLATPEDVAGAVSFLASDKSNFICGENIRVNGGQIMI